MQRGRVPRRPPRRARRALTAILPHGAPLRRRRRAPFDPAPSRRRGAQTAQARRARRGVAGKHLATPAAGTGRHGGGGGGAGAARGGLPPPRGPGETAPAPPAPPAVTPGPCAPGRARAPPDLARGSASGLRAPLASGPRSGSRAVTLRACPRPLAPLRLGALPSCSVTQRVWVWSLGSPYLPRPRSVSRCPAAAGDAPAWLRGLGRAAASLRASVSPFARCSRGVRAAPRGCGKHGARCLAVSRSGQETLPGSGVASPPRTLSGDLGQGRYPLWASAAHLRQEEESAVRPRPVVPAGAVCAPSPALNVKGLGLAGSCRPRADGRHREPKSSPALPWVMQLRAPCP